MANAPPITERPEKTPSASSDFEAFYLTHRVRLFRALLVVTRDAHSAEDVTQDAFVRIWERWDRVRDLEDPAGYLYRTALNGWFQLRRRATRAARRMTGGQPGADPLELVEDRDLLARRLLALPARQRAALVLTEYLEQDSARAGRILGIRPGTVRRLASMAKATLRSASAGDVE